MSKAKSCTQGFDHAYTGDIKCSTSTCLVGMFTPGTCFDRKKCSSFTDSCPAGTQKKSEDHECEGATCVLSECCSSNCKTGFGDIDSQTCPVHMSLKEDPEEKECTVNAQGQCAISSQCCATYCHDQMTTCFDPTKSVRDFSECTFGSTCDEDTCCYASCAKWFVNNTNVCGSGNYADKVRSSGEHACHSNGGVCDADQCCVEPPFCEDKYKGQEAIGANGCKCQSTVCATGKYCYDPSNNDGESKQVRVLLLCCCMRISCGFEYSLCLLLVGCWLLVGVGWCWLVLVGVGCSVWLPQ